MSAHVSSRGGKQEGPRINQGNVRCDYDVCLFWEFLANVEKNFFVEKTATETATETATGTTTVVKIETT